MPDCPVTVVLPCLDEAASLPGVLADLPAGYRALVVDNNSTGPPSIPPGIPAHVVENDFDVKGPEQAHQTALRFISESGIPLGVRWDDDLVPEPDCMAHLLNCFHFGNNCAAGGCYPKADPEWPVWIGGPYSGAQPPDGHSGHVQFFRWTAPGGLGPLPVAARHLYSGLMYHVGSALAAGGFCTDYSKAGYRAETDFSLRIGRCIINPAAIAIHHTGDGGIRSIPHKDYAAMAKADEALFHRRMTERGIDLSGGYWK